MLHEVPNYRVGIGEEIKYEAVELGLGAEEMYDLISVLDRSLSESLYLFEYLVCSI